MYTHRPFLRREVLSDLLGAVQETPEPTLYTQAWHIQATSLTSPAEKGSKQNMSNTTAHPKNMFQKKSEKTPF